MQYVRMRALRLGLSSLLFGLSFAAGDASAAPVSGSTTGTTIEVTASLSLGQLKPLRVLRARVGVGLVVFQNGNELLIRRLTTLPSMSASATLTSKVAGKALELLEVEEDASGNVFVLHRTGSVINTDRLVKIDSQGQISFDIAVQTGGGCYEFTPDDAGGLYVATYAPKLAQGFAINTGRPRVTRLSPTGTSLWENVAASDYKYKGSRCAIAKSAGGAYAAFTYVGPNASLDGPADVHFVSVNAAGLQLSAAENVAGFAAANPLTGQPVQIALKLDAVDLWDFDGPVMLGKTVEGTHHLVRYDAQGKVIAATEAMPTLFRHAGALYALSTGAAGATVNKFVPGASSFAKSKIQITNVASKPEHVFAGVRYDGNGMLVFYGKQGNFPAMGFARLDGTKLGSDATGMGTPFVDPFGAILVAGGKFYLVDRAAQTMGTSGTVTLPATGATGAMQAVSNVPVAIPLTK